MRRTTKHQVSGPNPLWQMYQHISRLKVLRNTLLIEISKFIPSMKYKRRMLQWTGMTIGNHTSLAYKVTPDIMYPELLTIGSNCVIGFSATLLCHEYLVDEYRTGEIIIGDRVLIGANVTVLPGVTIGDDAIIGAGAVVSKDIPAGAFAAGCPIQIREKG